jgi:hypothetical protein
MIDPLDRRGSFFYLIHDEEIGTWGKKELTNKAMM